MSIPISAKTGMRDHRWRIRGGSIRARLLVGFVLIVLMSAIGLSGGSIIVACVQGRQQVQDRLASTGVSRRPGKQTTSARMNLPRPEGIKMKHSLLATLILFLLLACAPTPASVPQTAGVTGAVTATPQVAIITPTHTPTRTNTATPTRTPTATRTAVPTATRTPKPPAAAKFTDGARTMYIDSGVVRVGVDKDWGGAIREIWFNGQNLVNNWDGGRLIGVSIYDGDAKGGWQVNIPDWGWNPGPSDKHNNVNRPITYSFDNGILYVKARCLQWNPDDKGGGKGRPVSTDAVVETWIKFVSDDPRAINVRYRVTYGGPDSHALAGQEMGFAYIRTPFNRFVTYAGNAPWTGALPRVETLSPFQDTGVNVGRETAATEQWAGFVNSEDVGLSMLGSAVLSYLLQSLLPY